MSIEAATFGVHCCKNWWGKIASAFGVLEEYKIQITNHKYQTNPNDQNSKFQTCFLFWSLKLGTRPQGGESGGPVLEFEICL
ncbi:MAG: hypothetical protein GWN93_01210 [Deltaproteobacteria bacterium]|nr:hypothetical protein [Deltaproteobacteria bacterium]